ncbi:putative extracellular signal-regulated kinase 1/2 [Schistosoma mansoni]|uniref:putative extracellular signal-regulated kinase 1/2 n=1 Tax=Schistosoma mansoni TaxID=6183 RepID=UPI0001A64175|nr:putative extracellular signal-regulated kinase 1/2 [Schistosoma mansoni]|eukprot:XP_018649754.1 putative extracellular signal-regulated kinase 1/2 [Schistosoma mansoni]
MTQLEVEPVILKNYTIERRIGKGAYGIVWKAVNKKTHKKLALKKIFDAFRNQTDAQRTFREISFLQQFSNHPNIIRLLNVIKAENDKDIYLVFEYMETDLNNCIKKGNILRDVHKKFIFYQLLRAVKYIHSGNVIHRDLKPSNILLNSDCLVKLCDFGLTRSLTNTLENRTTSMESFIDGDDDYENPVLTEYVATRWYRAPEILLASNRYTKYVDIWSLGCILGEMLLGKALFPGTSTINQIERIISVMERPTIQDIECLHSDYGRSVLDKALQKPYRPLRTLFSNNIDEQALNLLENMIRLNPEKRFTVEQALNHSYVEDFRDPSSEIVLKHPVTPILRDDKQLSVSDYRQKLYEIIVEKKAQHKMRKMLRSVELNENKTTGNSLVSKKELNYENTSGNKFQTDLINQNINRVGRHDPKLSNPLGNQQSKPTETANQYQCHSDFNETKSSSDPYNSQNQSSTNISHNISISSPVNHTKNLHSNSAFENEHISQSSVSNQPKSTSVSTIKASANSNLANNKIINNISDELHKRVTLPTSSVSSQKYKHEFALNSENLNNTQTMKISMSKEANNPVILRGNKNTSFGRNSQHKFNYPQFFAPCSPIKNQIN